MLKELRAKRRKQSLGEPFHGLGIVVKVENDIGYRPLSEKPGLLISFFFFGFYFCDYYCMFSNPMEYLCAKLWALGEKGRE